MVRSNQGHVVTISSLLGESAVGGLSDYCTSKFAVRGLHDAILREMSVLDSQVKCTVVCPFGVSTGMFDGVKLRYTFQFNDIINIVQSSLQVFFISVWMCSTLRVQLTLRGGGGHGQQYTKAHPFRRHNITPSLYRLYIYVSDL